MLQHGALSFVHKLICVLLIETGVFGHLFRDMANCQGKRFGRSAPVGDTESSAKEGAEGKLTGRGQCMYEKQHLGQGA